MGNNRRGDPQVHSTVDFEISKGMWRRDKHAKMQG